MADDLWLAFFVAASTAISPMIMAWLTNRNRRLERMEDYARQDLVAERADKVAEAAAKKAAEAANLLLAANERVAETAIATNQKLDVIHTLVNSNMTAALQSEFEATSRELSMMREVIDLKRIGGHEPTIASLAAIEATEIKLQELEAVLADRARQQQIVQKS